MLQNKLKLVQSFSFLVELPGEYRKPQKHQQKWLVLIIYHHSGQNQVTIAVLGMPLLS